jgi:hypothetical protein
MKEQKNNNDVAQLHVAQAASIVLFVLFLHAPFCSFEKEGEVSHSFKSVIVPFRDDCSHMFQHYSFLSLINNSSQYYIIYFQYA